MSTESVKKKLHGHGRVICKKCQKVIITCNAQNVGIISNTIKLKADLWAWGKMHLLTNRVKVIERKTGRGYYFKFKNKFVFVPKSLATEI
jgi:hypothetical protein